jgi:ATP-dependent DNA helicase RecQ
MLVRVFTLKFSPLLSGFDDGEVRDFLKDKEVLAIRDHFFVKDETPYLAVLVTYNLLAPEAEVPQAMPKPEEARREAWREALQEEDWPLFNTLRDWRNQQAREEGVPPYVICTNRQLAHIAHTRPSSLTKLGAVEGLGRAKIERYGGIILKLVGPETPAASGQEEGNMEQGECQPS